MDEYQCEKIFTQKNKKDKNPKKETNLKNNYKKNIKMDTVNLEIKRVEKLIKEKEENVVEDVVENVVEDVVENVVEDVVENVVEEENNKNKICKNINDNLFTLYNDECIKIMEDIDDESVDMILCDLPYGCTKNKWDIIIPFDELWKNYNRIIKKNGAIVLFGSQPFTSQLIMSNTKYFRYCLVWEKNKFSDFLNAKRKPMKTNEDICLFYKKQPTYNPQYTYGEPYKRWNTQKAVDKQTNYGGHKKNVAESKDGKRLPTTVLKFNRVERPKHPTQKPTDLLEWLIKTYTNENELVLDNCMGVGSTGVACKNVNRSFIGIELEEEYFKIAKSQIIE